MKKLLSILLAGIMLISAIPMVNASAQMDFTATNETVPTQEEATESTISATESTGPTTESTVPATEPTNPETPNNEKTYKDFTYSVKGNTVIILKYNGNAKTVKIPSEIDGKKVEVIGKKAFYKNKTLEKIIISDNVKEIKFSTFEKCVNLKKVSMGKNVKEIKAYAFYGCKKLKELKIPPKVKKLREGVVGRTGITTLRIGKNIESIHTCVFYLHNKQIEKIIVSPKNYFYSSQNGVLYNKKKTRLIICPRLLKNKELTIPSSVKEINDYSFEFNKNLQTVNFPNKLETIGMMAFAMCENLRKITLPKNVKDVQELAFANCSKLSNLTILNQEANIETDAFSGCGFKALVVSHEIESGFRCCGKLKKITILPQVKVIGCKQFFGCPKLKSVTIPETVGRIGQKALGFVRKYYDDKGVWKTVKIKGFTIKGKKNTAAYRYAKKHGFKFVEI
ncbi:MAG: leucine-rich repeat protein [Ruminococcus sp.]